MAARPNIVIVSPRNVATFVRQDVRLLDSKCNVSLVPIAGPASLLSLNAATRKAHAVILWFLGRHALPAIALASARSVPIITIIGGFEVAWESDIGYGVRPRSPRDSVLRWMLRRSQAIVTVSQFSHDLAASRFPILAGRMVLIHNAVDTASFTYLPGIPRSGVLCVAGLSANSIKVKNLELFRQVATAMPEQAFTLVGPALDATAKQFVRTLPENLLWLGHLSSEALVSIYRKSSLYLQISRHESFSLALAEAMASGCIPVISGNGALPEVGGSVARVVTDLSVEGCRHAIEEGLRAADADRLSAREHIVARFGTERRREQLLQLIDRIMRTRNSF